MYWTTHKTKSHRWYTGDSIRTFQLFWYLLMIYHKAAQYRLPYNMHNITPLGDNNANYMQQAVAYKNPNVLPVPPTSWPWNVSWRHLSILVCFKCASLCVWNFNYRNMFQHIYKVQKWIWYCKTFFLKLCKHIFIIFHQCLCILMKYHLYVPT